MKPSSVSASSVIKSRSEADLVALSRDIQQDQSAVRPDRCVSATNAGNPVKTGHAVRARWFGANQVRYLVLRQMTLELYNDIESFQHGKPCSSILLIGANVELSKSHGSSVKIHYSGKRRKFRMSDALEALSWYVELTRTIGNITPTSDDTIRIL
jgi:hypothetical protein